MQAGMGPWQPTGWMVLWDWRCGAATYWDQCLLNLGSRVLVHVHPELIIPTRGGGGEMLPCREDGELGIFLCLSFPTCQREVVRPSLLVHVGVFLGECTAPLARRGGLGALISAAGPWVLPLGTSSRPGEASAPVSAPATWSSLDTMSANKPQKNKSKKTTADRPSSGNPPPRCSRHEADVMQ